MVFWVFEQKAAEIGEFYTLALRGMARIARKSRFLKPLGLSMRNAAEGGMTKSELDDSGLAIRTIANIDLPPAETEHAMPLQAISDFDLTTRPELSENPATVTALQLILADRHLLQAADRFAGFAQDAVAQFRSFPLPDRTCAAFSCPQARHFRLRSMALASPNPTSAEERTCNGSFCA